jgi:outer membrane protein TolC
MDKWRRGMTMKQRYRWTQIVAWAPIALVMLGAIADRSVAQTNGLTLGEAVRTALAHNRALNAAREQGIAAQAGLTQARAGLLPRLDAEETFTETNNPTLVFSNLLNQQRFTQDDFAVDSLNHPSSLSNFGTRVRVEQPLFAGGKLRAGLDAAHAGIAAFEAQQARAEQETIFQTCRAYYGILLADGNLKAVDKALAASREHFETAQALFERGAVVRSDLLRAEVLVGSLERQRIDAENATRTARSQLNYIMAADGEIRLEESDAWPALDAPPGLDQSTEIALGQRPDLQAAEHAWQRDQAALRQMQADYLPSLGVIGQYEVDSENLDQAGDSYAVFVGARWNLFNGLATVGKAREAAAHAARSRLLRDDLAARIRVEVEQAWRGLTGATRQVEVAERNQERAKENLSIVRDRYSGGLARSVDVLDAVRTAQEAEIELLQARVSRQLRHAELDLATGRLVAPSQSEMP